MPNDIIQQFYTEYVQREWRRLVKDPYHRLEFDTTLHFLSKYLPEKGLILDAGGGPGRYTIELARLGYDLVLLDYTPANLDFARQKIRNSGVKKRVKEVVEGSIVDLSRYPADCFDAVISTGGPLSHILDPIDRDRAISELIRVARPEAPIFVSVMGRFSVLVEVLSEIQEEIEMPHFCLVRDMGDYQGGHGFTACHFFTPEELRAAFSTKPVTIVNMVGLEGISTHHNKQLNQVARHPDRWKIWLETHFVTCTHPSVVGISEHMLIICKKNEKQGIGGRG